MNGECVWGGGWVWKIAYPADGRGGHREGVFCQCVEGGEVPSQFPSSPSQGADGHVRVGKLNLVDLAGSERQSKTGATGECGAQVWRWIRCGDGKGEK